MRKDYDNYAQNLPDCIKINRSRYYAGNVCCVSNCRKKKGKGAKGRLFNMCYTHRQLVYKLRHPLRYFFNNMKQNAKRRRKEFDLSFEEYCALWHKSGRLPHVESDGKSWTVDRIDSSKGYVKGNVRIVDFVTNSSRILETNPQEAKILGLDFHIVCIKNGVSRTVIGEMDEDLRVHLELEYSKGEAKEDTGIEGGGDVGAFMF